MKPLVILTICLSFFVFTSGFAAESSELPEKFLVDESTGVKFPQKMTVEHDGSKIDLEITGVATRSKFLFKIYSVAHYMQDPVKGSIKEVIDEILTDGKAKVLEYEWKMDVDVQRIHEAYNESFQINLNDEQRERLSQEIQRLLKYLGQNAGVGDLHQYRWFKGGVVEFWINGKKIGTFKDVEFARGLWGFWFGPQSVVKRNDLVSQLRE